MPSRPETPRSILIRLGLVILLGATVKLWFPWYLRVWMAAGAAVGQAAVSGLPKPTPAAKPVIKK